MFTGFDVMARRTRGLQCFFNIPPAFALIVAALLKIEQLRFYGLSGAQDVLSTFGSLMLVGGEVALGGFLLLRIRAKATRKVAMLVFTVFLTYSIFRLANGHSACGCFGDTKVSPAVTCVVDAMLILCLFFWDARDARIGLVRVLVFPATLILLAFCLNIFGGEHLLLDDIGKSTTRDGIVVVETDSWSGKRLPVANFVEDGMGLLDGQWQVVFYHESCPACQELIAAAQVDGVAIKTAFVEIPPHGNRGRLDSDSVIWRELSDSHDWFFPTPQIIELDDGFVVRNLSELR